jgi:hypothetical protein
MGMRKKLITSFLAIGCALVYAQQGQNPQPHRPGNPPSQGRQLGAITNADVIKMVKAGLPDSAIVASIQSGQPRFDLSPDGLLALHQAGVSQRVLDVMMADGSAKPGTTASGNSDSSSGGSQIKSVKGTRSSQSLTGQLMRTKLQGASGPLDPGVMKSLQDQSAQAHNESAGLSTAAPNSVSGAGRSPTTSPLLLGNRSMPTQAAPSQTQASGMVGSVGTIGKLAHAPQPVSACRFSSQPSIATVSGKDKAVVFTPDPGHGANPANQYSIRGCNFGATQGHGEVHIYGAFINHGRQTNLNVNYWSDNLIVATFAPNFDNEYDIDNITLVVKADNGQEVQLAGNSFVAARETRALTTIPKGTFIKFDIHPGPESPFAHADSSFISPVASSNPLSRSITQFLTTARQQNWTAVLEHDMSIKNYPVNRYSWGVEIDFSKLHRGFVLDSDLQTVRVGYPDLDTGSIWVTDGGDCRFGDVAVEGALHAGMLRLRVQPMECDANGKVAWAHYALILSVTGPKGEKLDPWSGA